MTVRSAKDEIVASPPVGQSRNRQALSEESASYVRAMIMSGELREGEFVRLERIAGEMGISVTPVREGLLLLRGEGFVVLEPRYGFVVAPLSPADVSDLFFVQAGIAGELAARAARQVTDEDLSAIDEVQRALTRAVANGDSDAVVHLNHQLHRIINRSADSPKLAWFLSVAVRYVPSRFFASIEGWEDASAHDHAALIAALHEHDCEAARSSMQRHIRHAGELLVEHLSATRAARDQAPPATDGGGRAGARRSGRAGSRRPIRELPG